MKLKLTPDNIPMSISIPLNNGKTRHCIDVLGSKLLTGQINMANGKVCLIDLKMLEGVEIDPNKEYRIYMETEIK